jgi:hypothetical protein
MPSANHPETTKVRESECVLYEPETGQIRHMHLTLVLKGGHDPSEAETEAMAHAALERRGKAHAHLKALHVSHVSVKPYSHYRVDVGKKSLIEIKPANG